MCVQQCFWCPPGWRPVILHHDQFPSSSSVYKRRTCPHLLPESFSPGSPGDLGWTADFSTSHQLWRISETLNKPHFPNFQNSSDEADWVPGSPAEEQVSQQEGCSIPTGTAFSRTDQKDSIPIPSWMNIPHLIGYDAFVGRPPAPGLPPTVQIVGSDVAETGNLSNGTTKSESREKEWCFHVGYRLLGDELTTLNTLAKFYV